VKQTSSGRDNAIDALKSISILAVVLIHTTTRSLERVDLHIFQLPWEFFFNQASRFAVPLFLMISGFVLEANFSNHAGYLGFVKKRLSRVAVPFVFWSAVYYFLVYREHTMGFLQALILGESSYQLYFIPALLAYYLVFPILHRFYFLISQPLVLLSAGLVQILLLYQDYYLRPLPLLYPAKIVLLGFYAFLLGVVAFRHRSGIMQFVGRYFFLVVLVTVLFAVWVYLQGHNLFIQTGNYLMFYSQWRPTVLLYSIGVGAVGYYIFGRLKFFGPLAILLSRLSFFVFFFHVIVLEGVSKSITAAHPGLYLLTIGISFLAAFIVHKFPRLARITG